MNLQNGYKVVYEEAKDGKRTLYASKLDSTKNPGGVDTAHDFVIATLTDADFAGKVIYEYAGKFYVSDGAVPAYNEAGVPTDPELTGNFEEVFVKAVEDAAVPAAIDEDEAEEPVEEPDEAPDEAPEESDEPEQTNAAAEPVDGVEEE